MRTSGRRKWQAITIVGALAIPLAGCGILPPAAPEGASLDEVTEGLEAIAAESGSDGVLSLNLDNFTGPELVVAMAGDAEITVWQWTPDDGVESITDESLVANLKFQIDALSVDRVVAELAALPACDKRWFADMTPIGTEHAMALAMCTDDSGEAAKGAEASTVYFDGEEFERGSIDLTDPAQLADQVALGRELVGSGDMDLIGFYGGGEGGSILVNAAADDTDWEGEDCERTYTVAPAADRPFQLWCTSVGFVEARLPDVLAENSVPADTEYDAELVAQLAEESGFQNPEVILRGMGGERPVYELGEGGSMEADYYSLDGELVARLVDGELVDP